MKETRNYKITGRKEDLDTLEKVFGHIEYLGKIGASRNILIRIDGDGAGRIDIKDDNGNKLGNEKYNTKMLEVTIETRIIHLYIDDEYYCCWTGSETFDLIYDLIQAGIVEKVSD